MISEWTEELGTKIVDAFPRHFQYSPALPLLPKASMID